MAVKLIINIIDQMKESKTLKNHRDIKRTIVRSNTQKRCQQNQDQSLQNRARSTLCELSENNYQSQLVEKRNMFFEKQGSPWKGKQPQNQGREICDMKTRKNTKSVKINAVNTQQQSDYGQSNSFQKYTSIFAKIRQARLLKQSNNQQKSLCTTIITDNATVKKYRSQQKSRGKVISSLYKRWKDGEEEKRKSLNRVTSCCLIEIQESGNKTKPKEENGGPQHYQHWKKRNRKLKRKSLRKIKQNTNIPDMPKKVQYKNSNPFTKLLYDKYVKALRILRDSKGGSFHFL